MAAASSGVRRYSLTRLLSGHGTRAPDHRLPERLHGGGRPPPGGAGRGPRTPGAELHPSVPRDAVDVVVDAGYEPGLEGYSGFEETNLESVLREHAIEEVTVVGLATDYCVKHTAADALAEGFGVTIDRGGIRGIDVEPGDSERALRELQAAGATVT